MSCATILLPLPEFAFLRAVTGVRAVSADRTEGLTRGVDGVAAGFCIPKKEASVDCVRSLDAISREWQIDAPKLLASGFMEPKNTRVKKKKIKKRFF